MAIQKNTDRQGRRKLQNRTEKAATDREHYLEAILASHTVGTASRDDYLFCVGFAAAQTVLPIDPFTMRAARRAIDEYKTGNLTAAAEFLVRHFRARNQMLTYAPAQDG